MHVTGRWPIASPLAESADGLGAGAPAAVEAPPAAEPVESESLADHEASFVTPEPAPDDAPTTDRGADGKFKPQRHRAASQQADVDDLPTINAHTKRIKDAETKLGADIVKQDGESERAFTLRRRAELLERQAATPAPAEKREEQRPAPQPAPAAGKFPDFDTWFAKPENSDKTWDDYSDARTAHNYAVLRDQERHEESIRQETQRWEDVSRTYVADEKALRLELSDYDAVLGSLGPTDVSAVVGRAAIELGPRVSYYLASHLDILRALTADTMVHPDNPAFAATVAATKRYLSTLIPPVAGQRPSTPSSRSAAAPTGSAPAPRPSVPRPPNPVRTGALHAADEPPGDDASLDAHEKHWVKSTRR